MVMWLLSPMSVASFSHLVGVCELKNLDTLSSTSLLFPLHTRRTTLHSCVSFLEVAPQLFLFMFILIYDITMYLRGARDWRLCLFAKFSLSEYLGGREGQEKRVRGEATMYEIYLRNSCISVDRNMVVWILYMHSSPCAVGGVYDFQDTHDFFDHNCELLYFRAIFSPRLTHRTRGHDVSFSLGQGQCFAFDRVSPDPCS